MLVADLGERDGRAAVEAFFRKQVPGLRETPRLVRSRDGHFADKPENLISLINLATVRSLEAQWGYEIDPLRFRANIYVDGFEPWQEFDWIGADLRIGGVAFRVDRRNGRCGATNVNPVTGRRDLDIPGSLRAAFGHKDIGVYLRALEGGVLSVGDAVEAPEVAVAPRAIERRRRRSPRARSGGSSVVAAISSTRRRAGCPRNRSRRERRSRKSRASGNARIAGPTRRISGRMSRRRRGRACQRRWCARNKP